MSFPSYQIASANDVSAPASNTAAVVTYAANPVFAHVITGIACSYSGTPTGGNLKVEDGSNNVVFTVDITDASAKTFYFDPNKQGAALNTAMIITLAAGGGGITGKVSVLGYYLRQPLNS